MDLPEDWQSPFHCPQWMLLVDNFCSTFFLLVLLIFSSFLPAPLPALLSLAALGAQRSEVIYFYSAMCGPPDITHGETGRPGFSGDGRFC